MNRHRTNSQSGAVFLLFDCQKATQSTGCEGGARVVSTNGCVPLKASGQKGWKGRYLKKIQTFRPP